MSASPLISLPLRAFETLSRPSFAMPPGSWDTHVHIFGPAERYAHVATPHYTLPDGALAQYLRLMPHLGISRFVIVQPSYYGTDNSCLLDRLGRVGDFGRCWAVIEHRFANAELAPRHRTGGGAVGLYLCKRAREPLAAI